LHPVYQMLGTGKQNDLLITMKTFSKQKEDKCRCHEKFLETKEDL
jgi:hypothetical protein